MDLLSACAFARQLAKKAGEKICEIYLTTYSVDYKADNSPLTTADTTANNIICTALKSKYPHIPIVSEENAMVTPEVRQSWEIFWLVDPLDGTKEFINRNGEFTVNIALIKNGKPILGVVYTPVTGELYWAIVGGGSWKTSAFNDVPQPMHCSKFTLDQHNLRFVASKSHCNRDTEAYIHGFWDPIVVSRGSSLKLIMVAEGEADMYPRLGPTMEWDTAAADIIVREAGGRVLQFGTDRDLVYNKASLLNPHFLVRGDLKQKTD